jgi:hypothetical protein
MRFLLITFLISLASCQSIKDSNSTNPGVISQTPVLHFNKVSASNRQVTVHSNKFEIDWRKTDKDNSFQKLNIWYSFDNGKIWQLYCEITNPIGVSPIKVSFNGNIGFFHQKNNSPPPHSGTLPEIVVIVNSTKEN